MENENISKIIDYLLFFIKKISKYTLFSSGMIN